MRQKRYDTVLNGVVQEHIRLLRLAVCARRRITRMIGHPAQFTHTGMIGNYTDSNDVERDTCKRHISTNIMQTKTSTYHLAVPLTVQRLLARLRTIQDRPR
jgi:hypothetical protein